MKVKLFSIIFMLIWVEDQSQIITTIAGSGIVGYSGDGGPALLAKFNQPQGIAMDAAGNIFIADAGNNVIRKIDVSGMITTVAGNGNGAGSGYLYNYTMTGGYSGDGGPATAAELFSPYDVAVDKSGNIFIADAGNHVIRKVDPAGIISTVAGNHIPGYNGNYIPATTAKLKYPEGVAVDAAGNIYISDSGNNLVRMVTVTGIIKKIAGGGTQFPGDGGAATSAIVQVPQGIEVDAHKNVFIAQMHDNRIRRVDSLGKIHTVAGNSGGAIPNGYGGDGGPAIAATLNEAEDMAIDAAGNVFISDTWNYIVRRVDAAGIINRFAGIATASGYSGDGGIATSAKLSDICGIVLDKSCNLYVVDMSNSVIRKINFGESFTDSALVTNVVCGGSLGSISIIPPVGGYAPYIYNLGTGNQSSNVFTGLYAGAYTFTVTNSLGCSYTPAKTFTINQDNQPVAAFSPSPDTTCGFEPVNFNNTSYGNSFSWIINGATITDKEPFYYFSAAGTHDVKLYVSLEPGHCLDSTEHSIEIINCPPDSTGIVAPNIFTPNGDNINDLWQPVLYNYHFVPDFYQCTLYDRWGLKIFETGDTKAGWNGRTAAGQTCNAGTYFYVINVSGANFLHKKMSRNYRGFVELIR